MNPRIALCSCLIAWVLLMMMSGATVAASICQTVTVSSTYPHQASPNQQVQVTTTVAGSCTSDGEDYFAVRVDLADGVSKSLLSSNSVPIGYNASNFSVKVQNAATAPPGNQTWLIEVDTYMIQAGGLSGKYLLNATTGSIEVGSTPVPEFQADHSLVLLLALTATLGLYRRKLHRLKR
ncbi:MAG: hypothetical protein WB643_05450 [Candidatus Bathyarchaeia archaeon]